MGCSATCLRTFLNFFFFFYVEYFLNQSKNNNYPARRPENNIKRVSIGKRTGAGTRSQLEQPQQCCFLLGRALVRPSSKKYIQKRRPEQS